MSISGCLRFRELLFLAFRASGGAGSLAGWDVSTVSGGVDESCCIPVGNLESCIDGLLRSRCRADRLGCCSADILE